MIDRKNFLSQITNHLRVHEVCALLGPRQCGKTTLARQYAQSYAGKVFTFDLENPEDVRALQNPLRTLENLNGLIIIDEIQRLPDLFPLLRYLVDQGKARFLILGSASRDLIRQSSETLAGRIGYIELTPLSLLEGCDESKLIIRGGFPDSYLAERDEDSALWRKSYIRTFLERDIPELGFKVPPMMLQRFWMMLAHYHGQILNMDQIGKSLSISGHTARHYLDILVGTFMIRLLLPWFENTHKRQIKSPKLYIRDVGLMNTLSRLDSQEDLLKHPLRGAIWEGFALEQIIQYFKLDPEEAFFWRTQNGAELDLLVFKHGKRYGFEFKFGDAPSTTKSMHVALEDLKLEHLYVIYPGQRSYSLNEKITAVNLNAFILEDTFKTASQ